MAQCVCDWFSAVVYISNSLVWEDVCGCVVCEVGVCECVSLCVWRVWCIWCVCICVWLCCECLSLCCVRVGASVCVHLWCVVCVCVFCQMLFS